MQAQKLSISLPREQYKFVEHYQTEHRYKTRSEVISEALYLLQQLHLESCYQEANQEINHDFDITTSDGIEEDEAW